MILRSYGLPTWEFISGETKERIVTLHRPDGSLYELGNVTAEMLVVDFVNRDMTPVLTTTQSVETNEDGVRCDLKLTLSAEETNLLCGKYLYIAVITDDRGNVAKLRGPMIVHDKGEE